VKACYSAIILAGGLSSRMKQFKPLLPLDGETITDHVIATFLNCGIEVLLVAGYRHDDIKAAIKHREITFIYNPDYEQGMFSSIKAGIKCLQPSQQAFFILPVDIPLVRQATIGRLMDAAAENPGKIIYPVFDGKRGHPPLIPCSLTAAILEWQKDGGLKAVLDSYDELALEIPVADGNTLFDIDTPEDYRDLVERFSRYEVPTDEERDVILHNICNVAPDRIKHSSKVAEVAALISQSLNTAGFTVDSELVRMAAMLHDIAKGQQKHDAAGGQILRELGFGKVADIVAVHSDLAGGNTGLPLEAKIVYLADKFVEGERLVSLEERYSLANHRFGLTPEVEAAISKRLSIAHTVKKEIENLLSRSLEEVIPAKN
jgi:putative nucleotidyltransferase with HDIG domain